MFRIALPMLVASLALAGCGDPCANTEIASALSPEGSRRAVLFERSCGATTGFSTQVSIVDPGERPKGPGNAFVADSDHGLAVEGAGGGVWADIRWLSDDHLLVRHAAGARIFKSEPEVSGVKVIYATGRPPS